MILRNILGRHMSNIPGIDFEKYVHPPFEYTVTKSSLEKFCRAIGINEDKSFKKAPLTYMKVIEGYGNTSINILNKIGIDLGRILHAEQAFGYVRSIVPGDRLRVIRRVSDHYFKKNGTKEFLVLESEIRRAGEPFELVGLSRQVLALRKI